MIKPILHDLSVKLFSLTVVANDTATIGVSGLADHMTWVAVITHAS